LKKVNPDLKVLISLGSYRDGTTPFLRMLNNAKKRRDFVRNSISFLHKHGFDGLELNWNLRNVDFVHYSNQTEAIKFLMGKFVKQLNLAFKPFNLILSAMVSGLSDVAENSYEIEKLSK
jgi:chitinase